MGASWVVPALLALTAVILLVQASLTNHAATLIPKSWTWAQNRRAVLALVAVATALAIGSAILIPKAEDAADRSEARERLRVSNQLSHQTPITVDEEDARRLRWTPVLAIRNEGDKPMVIEDFIPRFPARRTTDGRTAQLLRVGRDSIYRTYDTFGALVESGDSQHKDDDFTTADEWPLLVSPGRRLIVESEQEYEFRVGGAPARFASDADLLRVLGTYLGLPRDRDGGFRVARREVPTDIVSSEDRWQLDVDYLVVPVGASFEVPRDILDDAEGR
jgi:hypothetical protein